MDRTRGRPFEPGNTQGRGRPTGSRNKSKSPEQDLLGEYALHLVRKSISMALQGDLGFMRLCLERIRPARLESCIRMSLPQIKTVQDVETAAETVTQAVRRGKITPTEGVKMMNILETRTRFIEKVGWESRIEKLEAINNAEDLPLAA